MSAWREHFLERYFDYRTKYVAAVREAAPARERWAVGSEIARLCFVLFGLALCGLVLWALDLDVVRRSGPSLGFAFVLVLALVTTYFGVLTVGGMRRALAALRRTPRGHCKDPG